jgi:lysophospholipid acyltransferase (LPLAT)-like uncharacterized protein
MDKTAENNLELHKFASLAKYTLRQRLLIYLADYFLYSIILVIGKTVRFEEVTGWENGSVTGYESYQKAFEKKMPGMFAFWHNRIFLITYFWRNYDGAIMTSHSFDGEYIARTAQRFGYGVIRGSSSRGGAKALKQMVKLARRGVRMALTVDGPRGPRYKVQSGAIHMAKRSGLPIGPMIVEAKKFWTINSWDKLQIPKPFTKAKVFIAEPVFVSPDADREELKDKEKELQKKLDELVKLGKQWRDSKN